MSVDRLSKKALQKILSGQIKEDAICIVKFYSNNCHLCHNLKNKYEEIASKYEDVHFFAFNIQDYPKVFQSLFSEDYNSGNVVNQIIN